MVRCYGCSNLFIDTPHLLLVGVLLIRQLSVCVCVSVCTCVRVSVCACVRVCVCVCA